MADDERLIEKKTLSVLAFIHSLICQKEEAAPNGRDGFFTRKESV